MKKFLTLFFGLFLFFLVFVPTSETKASTSNLNITGDLLTSYSNYGRDIYWNKWNSNSFLSSDGKILSEGFAFEPYYSDTYRMYATFEIEDYNYTTLETTVSLENAWKIGDRGKTEFVIYADKHKIYSKTFKNTTPSEKLKLSIPTGTKELTFYALMDKGSQGNHGAIFGEPKLTNSLPESTKSSVISLFEIGSASESDYGRGHYSNNWNDKPFENVNGSFIPRAVAFEPYYSSTVRSYVTFNVTDYDYSTLETNISLENEWKIGNLGISQAEIYADNVKIYSNTFTNTTPIQNTKLKLPKGTKEITFYVVQEKGTQGNHGIIFEDPILTNSLPALPIDDTLSLYTLGKATTSSSRDIYDNQWGSSAFQMAEGNLVARGYGFSPYYSSTTQTYAEFYIADYKYTSLETKISPDNKWRIGDRGTSKVSILADGKEIYSKTFDNKTPTQNVVLNIPTNTKYLKMFVTVNKGNSGFHSVIMENPTLTNRPWKPSVNSVTPSSTTVTGNTTPNATVYVRKGSTTLGKATADSKGNYKVTISAQPNATNLTVVAVDSKGRTSISASVVVKGPSPTLKASQVIVINNKGKNDSITVNSLNKDDVITVYNSKGTRIATSAKVKKSSSSVSVKQLGEVSGKILVSVTRTNMTESNKTTVSYKGEISPSLTSSQIVIVNNKGKSDTITVKGLKRYDVIHVYNSKGNRITTSAKVKTSSASVSVKQLGEISGKISVTVIRLNMTESNKATVGYKGEISPTLTSSQVAIVNKKGKSDTITVKSLKRNDVIKVYNSSGKLIATSKKVTKSSVAISIKQLGSKAGKVKVTLVRSGMQESSKREKTFSKEK